MSTFKAIRTRLGMTQEAMGEALGCTQGNVSLLDKGQTVLPPVAIKLVDIARTRGLPISMDHVYGLVELPPDTSITQPEPAEAKG